MMTGDEDKTRFRASLLAPDHWLSWLGVGAFSLLILIPRRLRDRLAGWFSTLQFLTNQRRRGVVEINLAHCFPHLDDTERRALARAHFCAYAQVMADQPSLWWSSSRYFIERRCSLCGLEHVRAARQEGRPVILLNAHTVGIDCGGAAIANEVPIVAIVRPTNDPVLDWIVTYTRYRFGGELFTRQDGLRPVIRSVRQGRCLYYSPDEDLGQRDSVFVPFFGQPKATLATLGRLARMTGASVIPVYTWYDNTMGRYEVCLQPPLQDFPTGDVETDAKRMNEALERSITLCPEQFLWNYRLFRTRQDGSPMPYPRAGRLRRALRWRRRRQKRRA